MDSQISFKDILISLRIPLRADRARTGAAALIRDSKGGKNLGMGGSFNKDPFIKDHYLLKTFILELCLLEKVGLELHRETCQLFAPLNQDITWTQTSCGEVCIKL